MYDAEAENTLETSMILHITEEVRDELRRNLISEKEIRAVIAHCETQKSRFWAEERGCYTGSRLIGYFTCWVEYQKNGAEEYTVMGAYGHKIMVEEGMD